MLAAALLVNVWLVCSEIKKTDVSNSEQLVSFIELYNKNPGEMDAYIEKFVKDYEKAAKTSKPYLGIYVTFPESIYTDNDYLFFRNTFIPLRDYEQEYKKTVERALIVAQGHIDEYIYLGMSEDSFEVHYQQNVINSYSKLQNVEFPMEYLRGYDKYLDYSGFGVIAMILLICGAVQIMIPEKVSGVLNIVRTTKNGRSETYLCKIICAFIYCLFVCVILSLSSYAAIYIKLGFSGGSLPIQAVGSFRLCPYLLTVSQGLWFSFGLRLLSCFAFMMTAFFISTLLSGYVSAFACGTVFTAVNYVVAKYSFLNAYAPLKNLNFLWSINGKEPICYWRGIKLFGACLPVVSSMLSVYIFLIAAFAVIGTLLFVKGKVLGSSGAGVRISYLLGNIKSWFARTFASKKSRKKASLCMFELKKLTGMFSVGAVILAIALSVYLSGESYNIKYSYHMKIYNEYMETLHGEWTEEKHEYICNEQDKLLALIGFKNSNPTCPEGMTFAEYMSRINEGGAADSKINTVKELVTLSDHLKELNGQGVKTEFIYKTGWNLLTQLNLSYIYLAVIILIFANIYACEYREGFSRIQRLSARGRIPVSAYKIMWAFLISAFIVTVCEGYQYFLINKNAGFDGASSSVLNLSVVSAKADIPIWLFFVLKWLRQLLVAFSVALATAVLSKLTKNILPTLTVMLVIVFAPLVFEYFGIHLPGGFSIIDLMSRA